MPVIRWHYGWWVAIAALGAVFGALGVARFGYSLVLAPMQADLALDNTQAGLLATANLIGYLALAVVGGAMASRYGPRRILGAGLSLAAVGLLMTGWANGFHAAAFWRTVTGVGSGAANIAAMGVITAWFAPRLRGRAAGIGVAGSSVGLIAMGPLVPRWLSLWPDNGWRICWWIYGAVTAILAIVTTLVIRNHPSDKGLPVCGAQPGEPAVVPTTTLPHWGTVYRSGHVWHLGLTYAAFGFSYIIFMTFFARHLLDAGGYSQAAVGRLFTLMGWCSLLCGVLWGGVSDRIGRKWAMAMVYLLQAAAFGVFAVARQPAGFLVAAVLFGLTAWSIPAIMAAACGDILGSRLAPAALGFITLFFGIGQALGPVVAGAMADRSGSFTSSLLLAAAVAVGGAAGSISLRKT